ncbi:hypothetical protein Pfo_028447 [Paulownia fortunei]|nr:hypothetical protein Pfo_028447 [Paulownia fortunei]
MEKPNSEDFFDIADDGGYDAVVVGSGYGGSVAACRMSMAGFKVCLLEKGRRWEAQDFPTDSFTIWSAVRMENMNLGVNVGPKDALFQIHIQDDSLAATACGLGGGSLVNAGVMLPTTVRARRDPKWPKAWEKDWEKYEASASDMLRIQSIPMKFQNSKIMQEVIDKEYDKNIYNPLKLSVSRNWKLSSLWNCLAGCPYNAKNSTDKTYLVSAIQAGCTIKTVCEVQYVVRNEDDNFKEEGGFKGRSPRRWLVFVNEFDYVASDIVILSDTFSIAIERIASLTKLGSGLSCNGNNEQFSNIPFQERPGPSISSSYTSSLGFTIQSAVIPTAYPGFLFKGITTYGWQSSNWFLLDMIDRLKHIIGLKCSQAVVLNAMGYDDSNGKLTFQKDTNRIMFQPPHDPLLPRKLEAFQKFAKKLGGILYMSRYRSTSVHLLGGCIASSDVSSGVCNPDGQVFDNTSPTGVHPGLYICDASIIPCSVGINPCLTIAAAAEHVSRNLVQDAVKYIGNFVNKSCNQKQGLISKSKMKKSCNSEVVTKETMRGQVGGMPCTAYLKLRFRTSQVSDKTGIPVGISHPLLRGKVGGHILCKGIEMDKMYIIHGEVDLCKTDIRTPYTHICIIISSLQLHLVQGKKTMNPYILALYAWKESTTLNVTLREITNNIGEKTMNLKGKLHISLLELLKSMGTLKGGSKSKFIFLLMQSLLRTYILQVPRGSHIDSTALELARPYPNSTIHEIKTEDNCIICCQHWLCSHSPPELDHDKKLYPVLLINGYSTESYCLPTEPNDLVRTLLKEGHDVLLLRTRLHPLNSSDYFSIEDIGRIDIPAGKFTYAKCHLHLPQSIRSLCSRGIHKSTHSCTLCGGLAIHISLMGGHVSDKHIASLSCTNSSMFFKLTTSSSVKMWLPLVPSYALNIFLSKKNQPADSMAIMGKNKTLPLLQTSTTSFRQRLLKSIAHLIPRYERCTCDECEVFSGIFGNTFWHENISQGNNAYLIHPERMALPTLYISGGRTLLVTPETSFLANKYMKLHQPGYRHERVVVDGFGHSDLLIGEKSHENVFPHIQKHIELAEEEINSFRTPRENKYMKEALAWSADPYEDGGRFEGGFPIDTITLLVLLFNYFSYQVFS